MKIVFTQPKERIANFVTERVGQGRHFPWEQYSAVGLLDGKAESIVAGVVYNHYSGTNVCAHIAGTKDVNWLTPTYLFAIFDYPFREMGVNRLTALIPEGNSLSVRFSESLGFTFEGCMREALPSGEGMLIYGMLREECKWITPEFSGLVAKRLGISSTRSSSPLH